MSIGVEKIKIPLKKKELTLANIEPYLEYVLSTFQKNQTKIRKMYNIYLGGHDVLNKQRPYSSDKINHQVVTPHLSAMVDFKCGYSVGNPKEFALNDGIENDEMKYLNRYWEDVGGRTVDVEITKWIYSSGVGYYFIQPKEIIEDIENKSPFELFLMPADTCTKVYSSYIGEEALFDVIFTEITRINNGKKETYIVMSIYLPTMYAEYKCGEFVSRFELIKSEPRKLYRLLPLVEKYAKSDKVGLVENGLSVQNAIDNLMSSTLDNIDDVVNLIYVFYNVSLGTNDQEKLDTFASMKENGVVELLPSNPQFPADLKTLTSALNLNEIDIFTDRLIETLYNCNGVPLQTASVGSGNNAAAEAGAGWKNAYTIMLNEVNSMRKGDRDLLEHILWICKNTKGCPIRTLNSNDIEPKYNINRDENLLIKAQAWDYFREDVPPALRAKWVGITNEPDAAGKAIEEYKDKLAKQEAQNQINSNPTNIQE